MMTKTSKSRGILSLVSLCLAVGLLAVGCATAFVGAAKATDVQKAVVEDAFKQLVKLHDAKLVSDGVYEAGKGAYNLWAAAERVAADSLAAWKKQVDADKASGKPTESADLKAKAEAAFGVVTAAARSFFAFLRGIPGVRLPGGV